MRHYRLVHPGRFIAFLSILVGFIVLVTLTTQVYSSAPEQTRIVTIGQGDSLWRIASRNAQPHEDVRDVIIKIKKLNHLDRSEIQMGKTLLVPVRDVQ